MRHPEDISQPCIACGAMNQAGAEVCAGSGHRLREPARAQAPPGTTAAPDVDPPRRTDDLGASPITGPRRRSGRVGLAIVIGLATVVAAPIAFVATCSAFANNLEGDMGVGIAVGSLAAVAVVTGAGFLIYSISRSSKS